MAFHAALTGGGENSVGQRGGRRGRCGFAKAADPFGTTQQLRVEPRRLMLPHPLESVEVGLLHGMVLIG